MSELFLGRLSYVVAAFYEVLLIYMFLKDFLGNHTLKWEKSLAFVLFFIFSTLLNMYVHIPFVTLMYDLVGIFALSFFFDGDWKTKIFASVLFIAFLIVSEIMTLLSIMILGEMSANTALEEATNRLLGVIISKTLLLILVKVACAVRKKSYVKIPLLYWLALIFITLVSILSVHNITVINMMYGYTQYTTLSFLIVIGLCFTNVLVFYLFESILRKKELEINNKLLEQQIEYQVNHYEELQVSQTELRRFRHDVKNHLFVVMQLLEEKNDDEALKYLHRISNTKGLIEKEVVTGNPVIDSLVTANVPLLKIAGSRFTGPLSFHLK